MSARAVLSLLGVHLAVTVLLCALARRAGALVAVDGPHVVSAWKDGQLVGRAVNGKLEPAPDTEIVDEHVVGEGALFARSELAFALGLVPGRDGVAASYGGVTVYATPDDLLSHQAYDKGLSLPGIALSIGADVPVVEALLADRLGLTVPDLLEKATFRRIRSERVSGVASRPYASTRPEEVTPDLLRGAALDMARYLARGMGEDGKLRYFVDATTNRAMSGYDWPRHAGAAYFLAQAAALSGDADLRAAAGRAASLLRDRATVSCGDATCIGTDAVVDIGSSALALVAFAEMVRSGMDTTYRDQVVRLAAFVRSQQRADGEFMHFYDRIARHPIDEQTIYYSGEATLALARAHDVTRDPADLDGARRGLAHLVGPAWSFFGARYYFGEEHWTCQAMADLWDRAPDAAALDFCVRWREYDARMMHAPGETPFDADGSFGVGPVVTPRLTPVASRTEAGAATLDVLARVNADPGPSDRKRRASLRADVRRSFAFLLRHQLRPGLTHLLAAPGETYGAMPGSEVDWQLRIDYVQHAGSAMLRGASVTAL
jgi:hypothetical protein